MNATIYRANKLPVDISIPHDWSAFCGFVGLGVVFLLVAAILAKVKIRDLPGNPLYWHFWVIANAEVPPLVSSNSMFKIYRPYMFFWAGSLGLFLVALLVLVSMLGTN